MNENEKIVNVLENANNADDVCKGWLIIADFDAEYRKTNFYKKTGVSLKELYRDYKERELLTLNRFLQNLKNAINEIDAEHLRQVLEEMNEKMYGEIQDSMKKFEESGIKDLIDNN